MKKGKHAIRNGGTSLTADLTKWQKILAKATGTDVYARVGVLASRGGDAQVDPRPLRTMPKKGEEIIMLGVGDRKKVQTPPPAPKMTLVELASIHEFGSPGANIPERSFIRRTMKEREDDIQKLIVKLTWAVISTTTMTVERAVGLIGEFVVGAIRQTIVKGEGVPPPNSPRTIARKGSSRPLVDTGQLISAITYEVVGGEQRRLAPERQGGV